jgi:predicted nucleic acid-binding protein
LNLYLDASALVKRYVKEGGSEMLVDAMDAASDWSMCRIGFVETVRAVACGGDAEDVERFEQDWINFDIVEVDRELAERAAEIARATRLRALDALHLAAALRLGDDAPTFATWDARLHRAAHRHGLRTLPASL